MMLGPMKKKMITTGVIAFLIPTVAFGTLLLVQNNKAKNEIAKLQQTTERDIVQVFSGDLPVNHVIASDDIRTVEVISENVPEGAFVGDSADKIIGRKLKIAVQDRTIVNELLFFEKEDNIAIDIRSKEFNMITLPSDLNAGDFIDVRILFPTGEDFLVVAGKEIKKLGATTDSNAIFLDISEEELLRLSSAVIESYISDSIKVYAIKYVKPNPQLYHDENVDYVAKYNDALEYLIKENTEIVPVSGDPMRDASGDIIKDENGNIQYEMKNEEKIPQESDFKTIEIASAAGISEDDAEAIREALRKQDTALLNKYKNYSVTVWTTLEENYPVRQEVAALVERNPNILDDLKAKYNIEALEAERQTLINTSIYKLDEYTGEISEDDSKKASIANKLNAEIESQKTERKEYLQALLRNSMR